MSKQLARTVVNGFNRQVALLDMAYADSLIDTIRNIAEANDQDESDNVAFQRENLLATYGFSASGESKPFAFANGIAFIPVTGLLLNRFSSSWGWVTGYNFIRNQLNAALADDDVTAIVFDCDSGGGMVAGCFELANDIYNSRSVKPSVAIVDAASYSACYAVASSASKIIAAPSAGVGSIGVVAMHVDYSKMLTEAGIKVTFIHAGKHKVDGNPYQALPASVKADIQKSVDANREEFVALVARNRGVDPKVIHDTEAQCYGASEALSLGLIDAIAPPSEAVMAFINELSGSEPDKEKTMSTSAVKPGAESTADAPENKQANAPANVDVTAERTAERERIKAIQSHASAQDKPALANHLALNTDLSVEAAAAILAAAAPEKKEQAQGGNAFQQAMDNGEHPQVGADADPGPGKEMSAAQRILQAQSLATGVKH